MKSIIRAVLAGFVLVSTPTIGSAQDATTHTGVEARIARASVELGTPEGLAALSEAVGDARIVMLGEPWHGDGGAMVQRARIVRFLHEEMGFDVLAFEADFYAMHHAWRRAGTERPSETLTRNLYPFWGRNDAMDELWEYVDRRAGTEHPLIVAGIDTKLTGRITREEYAADLETQLRKVVDAPSAERLAETLDRLLNPRDGAPQVSDEEFAALRTAVEDLEATLSDDDAVFWSQAAESLRRQLSGESRDPGMAENLIWLATRMYPESRIIVWAHNNHVMADKWMLYDAGGPEIEATVGSESQESVGRRTYLGEATRHYFGDHDVFTAALISNTGNYSTDVPAALMGRAYDFAATAPLEPAPEGSVEAAFHAEGRRAAFVDLRPFRAETQPVRSRVLDYTQIPPLPMNIWQGFDGLIYLDQTHGLESAPRR